MMQIGGRNLLLNSILSNGSNWGYFLGSIVDGSNSTVKGHYYDNTSATSGYKDFLSQDIHKTNKIIFEPSTWYTFSFYAKGTAIRTHIYPSIIDTTVKGVVDGVSNITLSADGYRDWTLTDKWTRHTYTFKTKATISTTDTQRLLFRLNYGNKCTICMPQLEKGTKATDWTSAPEDTQSQIDANKTEISSTKSKVSTIETNLSGITQRVSTVEQKQTTVDGKVTSLETWKKSAEQKITDVSKLFQPSVNFIFISSRY